MNYITNNNDIISKMYEEIVNKAFENAENNVSNITKTKLN